MESHIEMEPLCISKLRQKMGARKAVRADRRHLLRTYAEEEP